MNVVGNRGITGLHHIGISTPDLERLVAFYCGAFGFEVEATMEWADEPEIDHALGLKESAASMVMLCRGNIRLEVFQYDSPDPGPAVGDKPVSDAGINHICFLVDDLTAEVARLTEAGLSFLAEPSDVGDGPFAYGRDPDGNVVELWQIEVDQV